METTSKASSHVRDGDASVGTASPTDVTNDGVPDKELRGQSLNRSLSRSRSRPRGAKVSGAALGVRDSQVASGVALEGKDEKELVAI